MVLDECYIHIPGYSDDTGPKKLKITTKKHAYTLNRIKNLTNLLCCRNLFACHKILIH